jgi:hypothetical protein
MCFSRSGSVVSLMKTNRLTRVRGTGVATRYGPGSTRSRLAASRTCATGSCSFTNSGKHNETGVLGYQLTFLLNMMRNDPTKLGET